MLKWSLCACCVVGMMFSIACEPDQPKAASTQAKSDAALGAAKAPAPPKPQAEAKLGVDESKEDKAKQDEELPRGAQWIYGVSIVKGDLLVEHSEYSDKEPVKLEDFDGSLYGKLLPPQTDKLPKTLTMLKGYDLMLGDKRVKAERIKGWKVEGGAGRTHVFHVLELPEGLAGTLKAGEDMYIHPALAVDLGRLSEKAVDERAKPKDLSGWKMKTHKAEIEALAKQIKEVVAQAKPRKDEEGNEELAQRQAKDIKSLNKLLKGDKWLEDVTMIEGSFEQGYTAAISFALKRGEAAEDGHLSGLFFVDKEGKVARTVFAPYNSWEGIKLHKSLDVDGDGKDELLYESFYYEGSHTYLLKAGEDGVYKSQLISGDGA